MKDDLRSDRIQRQKELKIKVNGEEVRAFSGETVMAALYAAGIKTFKKSSTIHEDRGPLCGMGVCYECLLTIDGTPDQRACMTEVREGMEIEIDE